MSKNLENELREAYFTLWEAVENGIDTDKFFELREAFRGIRSMVEEDDKKVNIGVTTTPVKGLNFDDIKTTGPTIEEMQKLRPSDMENVRNCPGELHDYQKEVLDNMVRDGRSTILILPTGKGMTKVFSEVDIRTKLKAAMIKEYQLYLDHC